MLSYWLLLVTPVLTGVGPQLHRGAARVATAIAALTLIAMIGLRYVVGCDWYNYIDNLDSIRYTNPIEAISVAQDPGYGLLEWLSLQLGLDIYGVNIGCGIIFTWGLLTFCRRQPIPWLTFVIAVPMLVIIVGMGFTRQAVAIGFLMLSFVAFEDKKLIKFLVFVALAASFHKTAVVATPLAAFVDPKRVVSPLLAAGLATAAFLAAFLTAKLDYLTYNYIGNAQWEGEGSAAVYRLSLNLGAAIVFFAMMKKWRRRYTDTRLYFIFSLVAVAAFPFAFVEPVASDRMSLYLLPYQVSVYSRIPDFFERPALKAAIISAAVVASGLLMWVWFTFAKNSWCWMPYGNLLFQ